MKRKVIVTGVVLGVAALLVVSYLLYATSQHSLVKPVSQSNSDSKKSDAKPKPEVKFGVFAKDLDTPWSMAFLPNGDMLVTERSGKIVRIGQDGKTFPIKGVTETSEGGLLGLALHPDFAKNHLLYLYLTTSKGGLHNQVVRYTLSGDTLTFNKTIIADIPAGDMHDGGGIAFGPDGKLYVTTGENYTTPNLAQDKQSLAGKILRINDDGSTPSDNPFGNLVWSYGHRNPQGITWDNQGRMWATEHGPSAAQGSGQDELNLIVKGGNYGWPIVHGSETAKGMRSPIIQSGSATTWAPSGIAYADGSLFFAGLRGQTLYQAVLGKGDTVTLKEHFAGKYGRLRAVAVHDGVLYFSTSNRDGRGSPKADDDRIFQAPLSMFK